MNLTVNPAKKKIPKTKIKSCGSKATNFHDEEISKIDSNYTCVAVELIDFVFKWDENYYPQVFLKEFKDNEEWKKVTKYINSDHENFFYV